MKTLAIKLLALVAGFSMSTAGALCAESAPRAEAQTVEPLHVGTKAPNFTRMSAQGKKLSLKSFKGKLPVVLYFYPKDETPNCIKEACGFRDFHDKMAGKGAAIIGVSGDSEEAHEYFMKHYSLPFDLIADYDNSLLRLYHVPWYKGTLHKRVTFIIDKDGIIKNVIDDTNDGDEHVKRATAALENLAKQ
jgi:peroxiredoxin Q/BCP